MMLLRLWAIPQHSSKLRRTDERPASGMLRKPRQSGRIDMRLSMPLILLCLSLACFAQPPASRGPIADANLPAQPLGPNDLLAVEVYDAPEFTRTVRVSSEGAIRLPMLERKVAVTGLLPAELETKIASLLEEEKILVKPVVTVTVAEYHSRPVSVAGAVEDPVTFQAMGEVTLLDALTRAGGLTENAGPTILVTSPASEPGDSTTRRVPVKELIEARDPALNLKLHGGEKVSVPEGGHVFVAGNVRRPGKYLIPREGELTVLEALALSEGLLPHSSKLAYIYRQSGGEAPAEVPVQMRKILKRKSADVALEANDILYVPDDRGKQIAAAALEKILLFGSSAGATALVYSTRYQR